MRTWPKWLHLSSRIAGARNGINQNPGEHPLCQLCEKHHYCSEMLDLNAPIFLNNRVIGVIGIICSTCAQRDTLLSQIDKFVTFIEQIAVMISSKVFECPNVYAHRKRLAHFGV